MDSAQRSPRAAARPTAKRSATTLWSGAALVILIGIAGALFSLGFLEQDAGKPVRTANAKATQVIQGLPSNAELSALIAALNQMVVPFVPGSHALPAEAEPVLQVAAQRINALPPHTRIDVIAIATTTPSSDADHWLIMERASTVVAYLEKQGVAPGRLRAIGSTGMRPSSAADGVYTGPLVVFRPHT